MGWFDGAIKSITNTATAAVNNVTTTATRIVEDVKKDPLGALGGAVVTVSAAPVIAIATPAAAQVGGAAWLGTKATDALGLTQGANAAVEKGMRDIIEHPAELGRLAAEIELTAAAALMGGKALASTGGTKPAGGSAPPDDLEITNSKPAPPNQQIDLTRPRTPNAAQFGQTPPPAQLRQDGIDTPGERGLLDQLLDAIARLFHLD